MTENTNLDSHRFMNKESKNDESYTLQPPQFSSTEKKSRILVPIYDKEIKKNLSQTHYDTSSGTPPLCTTNFSVIETLNSDPNLIRSTMYVVPKNNTMLENLGIPLSFIINPFNHKSYFNEIDDDPVQCIQCLGYFNSYSILFEPLNGFKCNLCGTFNKADKSYNFVTAEYKLKKQKEYGKKKGIVNEEYFDQEDYLPPCFVFCIELSKITIATNFYYQVLDSINKILEEENFKNVSIVIFTDEILILKNKNNLIHEENISDLTELPLNNPEILFDYRNKNILFEYLHKLKPKNTVTSVYSLLKYLTQMGNFFVGSKIAFFTSSSKEVFETEIINNSLLNNRVNVNVFTIGQNDLLEKVVSFTNGKTYKFVNNTDDLLIHLQNLWGEKSVYGVNFQVKHSDQIGKKEIYGNGEVEGTSLSVFSHMDSKSTIGVSFFIEEEIKQEKVFFQIILNYYKEDCQRYLLVCNLGLDVSANHVSIFNNLCFDTIFCSFTKFILNDFNAWVERKKEVCDKLIKTFSYYRKKCAQNPSPTHLHIPESLKLLPLMLQSMEKGALFTIDLKYHSFQNLLGASVLKNLRYFYPRLISFSEYFTNKSLETCENLSLTMSILDENEIYVLDNGEKIYCYFGKEVLNELKNEIKGGKSEEKEIFNNLLEEIHCEYFSVLPLIYVEENSLVENEFFSFFIEDKLHGQADYEEFVCELHFKVRKASQ
ncbi:hypothetical protein H312_02800, partial [Anncaliia algerae PRA339]